MWEIERCRQKDRQMTNIHTEKDRQGGRGREIHTEKKKSKKKKVTEITDRQTDRQKPQLALNFDPARIRKFK